MSCLDIERLLTSPPGVKSRLVSEGLLKEPPGGASCLDMEKLLMSRPGPLGGGEGEYSGSGVGGVGGGVLPG
jgi:hypothetical protein